MGRPTARPVISVIIPVLNEGPRLAALLRQLRAWREAGDEIVVVDGGSDDGLKLTGGQEVDHLLSATRGRASQMNAGARVANGRLLLFLHADTRLERDPRPALLAASTRVDAWGRFDVAIGDPAWPFRIIEKMMNLRSRLTGIATGDQGLFVRRELFESVGGYPDIALMEDIELSKVLKRQARPICLRVCITTSARRWRSRGIARTVLLMWTLRLAWFLGVPAPRLARLYGYR